MAEDAHDAEAIKKDAKEASLPEDIESQIKTAMSSRVAYFKEQADSLTFESVRRLLEKDLGLQTLALDVHRRFIKQCLLECFDGKDDGNASKNSGEKVDINVSTTSEVVGSPKGRQPKKEVKEQCSEDEEKMEDSPVFGLLSGHKTAKTESIKTEQEDAKEVSEGEIKKAIRKRASYVIANSDKVTMAGLRRLLEEDMKLDKHTLDPYKKFISEQIDEVLKSREVSAPASEAKKNLKKDSQIKASRKSSTKKSSNSSGDEEEEEEEEEEEDNEEDEEDEEDEEEEEERPKGKFVSKGRPKNSEGHKKRKKPEKETKVPSKKKIKAVEKVSDGDSDAEGGGVVSEDSHSRSSAEKTRKEASTPIYGKHVEHLKSVIKSCAMSVPPAIYKKAKQAPENKREAVLIKELEGILSKEGLSPNPTEKEIKEVRKRKERAKELEGIDTSNIVSNSRRRSTTSFVPPPKPKITDASDDDDTDDDNDDDNDDDDDDDDDGDNDDEEDGGDEGDDESQSEDSNDEEDEDSD
ncbi:hypothetical protein SLEP1_g2016 [Rubroshorea leprosula]|uniref:DEK-C domain-containing protein n=1 Tax=Rubroshorea leprosula TaxID=152421 RepID=A0AAV5HFR8_9ROSI|nr:hypothetical protein SLEP1_g2016 [Rubroshorea leprosula]